MDVAYGPFIERFQIVFSEVYKNDITNGRPKLAAYIEVYLCVNFIFGLWYCWRKRELNGPFWNDPDWLLMYCFDFPKSIHFTKFFLQELSKIDAYKPTKVDPKEFVEVFKKRFLVIYT